MGCGGSKVKKPTTDNNQATDVNTRPSVVMDPRTKTAGGPHDPWEQPKPLPSPYPKGNADAVINLIEEDEREFEANLAVQQEIVKEPLKGKLVPESQVKK